MSQPPQNGGGGGGRVTAEGCVLAFLLNEMNSPLRRYRGRARVYILYFKYTLMGISI